MRPFLVFLAAHFSVAAQAQPPTVEEAFRELNAASIPPVDDTEVGRAAAQMVEAVEADPDHRAAIVGLYNAAHAFASLGRRQSAERLWKRVVDEGMPRMDAVTGLENPIASALMHLGNLAARRGDWSAAAEAYRTLSDSPRFAGSRLVGDALVNASVALERLGEPRLAARYMLGAVEHSPARPGGPQLLSRAAELFAIAGDWAAAQRTSERFLRGYGRTHEELARQARERLRRAEAELTD